MKTIPKTGSLPSALVAAFFLALIATAFSADTQVIKYVRFRAGETVAYGRVEGERVRELSGDLFATWKGTDRTYALSAVKLLVPSQPTKVLALALNYRSHQAGSERPLPTQPEFFFKPASCLIAHEETIILPRGSTNVHFEAELVIVIGKRAKNVSAQQAGEYVFGVTCGNDVSARDWQKQDIQWWRAKGTDTFGPVGPWIVSGLKYDDLLLQLRVNGEMKQKQRTADLVHNIARSVSFASQHVTLEPGDLIYTGTPGETSALKAGDTVEVELEGVGILRNRVAGPN